MADKCKFQTQMKLIQKQLTRCVIFFGLCVIKLNYTQSKIIGLCVI